MKKIVTTCNRVSPVATSSAPGTSALTLRAAWGRVHDSNKKMRKYRIGSAAVARIPIGVARARRIAASVVTAMAAKNPPITVSVIATAARPLAGSVPQARAKARLMA